MRRNKARIQLGLYARPKHPGTYHYALFVAPKNDQRSDLIKHHVKNTLQIDASGEVTAPWRYERNVVSNATLEQHLLVRVVIAKVAKTSDHVESVLASVPIYQIDDVQEARSDVFTCRTWVRDAFEELRRQGVVTAKAEEWEAIECKALEYLDRKRKQRRWSATWAGRSGVPLMDLLDGKEVVA